MILKLIKLFLNCNVSSKVCPNIALIDIIQFTFACESNVAVIMFFCYGGCGFRSKILGLE